MVFSSIARYKLCIVRFRWLSISICKYKLLWKRAIKRSLLFNSAVKGEYNSKIAKFKYALNIDNRNNFYVVRALIFLSPLY